MPRTVKAVHAVKQNDKILGMRRGDILTSLSVNKPGQNSISSSRSNDRVASNLMR